MGYGHDSPEFVILKNSSKSNRYQNFSEHYINTNLCHTADHMYAAAMPTGIDRDDVSAATSCYMRKIDRNRGS